MLIACSVEEGVPTTSSRGSGKGWVTAEYAMHPRANPDRQNREGRRRRPGRRPHAGDPAPRSAARCAPPSRLEQARRAHDLTSTATCSTPTAARARASITGGFVALVLALDSLRKRGLVAAGRAARAGRRDQRRPVEGSALLDLCYDEDRDCQVDLNLVATASGNIVEVQGTAEGAPMTRKEHDALVDLGARGIAAARRRCSAQALERAGVDLDAPDDALP